MSGTNWCCLAFKTSFDRAGMRGFSVFVSIKDGLPPAFILQHRSLDPGASLDQTDVPLALVSDSHIYFCPWCGANLPKRYNKTFQDLVRSDLKI
jgi:hypothetical protein